MAINRVQFQQGLPMAEFIDRYGTQEKCKAALIAFSLSTIWEVAIKTSLQRPGFAVDSGRLRLALLAEGFNELPVQPADVVRVAALPWIHRDPFDRLMVAQAAEEGLTLLTADAVLKGYGRFVKLV
jgi:PIN domain nuclease of toxin-antitoxin system